MGHLGGEAPKDEEGGVGYSKRYSIVYSIMYSEGLEMKMKQFNVRLPDDLIARPRLKHSAHPPRRKKMKRAA
jgi:hypothetical protein